MGISSGSTPAFNAARSILSDDLDLIWRETDEHTLLKHVDRDYNPSRVLGVVNYAFDSEQDASRDSDPHSLLERGRQLQFEPRSDQRADCLELKDKLFLILNRDDPNKQILLEQAVLQSGFDANENVARE